MTRGITGGAAIGLFVIAVVTSFYLGGKATPSSIDRTLISSDTMRTRMNELKKRLYSPDQDTSGLALGELIKLGTKATPVLLEALAQGNPRTRRLAAEGLGEIADPAAADALYRATKDPNDEVRARAATALHALGDPRSVVALVATINDYPDILHSPNTASMYPLMRGGRDVLPLIVPLLRSPDQLTRQRAFLVLRAVVSRLPQGSDWDHLWQSLDRYDPVAPEADRARAADAWQRWLRTPPAK